MHGYDYMMAEYTIQPYANLEINIGSNTPVLMFFIFLEGSLLRYSDDGALVEHMLRLQWNIMFLPVLNERLTFRKNECYRIFVVHFELSYLLQVERRSSGTGPFRFMQSRRHINALVRWLAATGAGKDVGGHRANCADR